MKSLLLLGSTGSIGTQTLDIVRAAPRCFRIAALGAYRSWELVLEQALEFKPDVVGMVDPEAADALRSRLPASIACVGGAEAARELASEAQYDLAVHGIVGASGVLPSRDVLARGKPLALANKESLVVAGQQLMELSRQNDAPILPVDSEHSAIYQCLRGEALDKVRSVWLTASGGPFRATPLAEFDSITPAMALRHPNWEMGPRITIGSATLMNKALEVIETHHLYGLAADQIRVVIHHQSIVHSMVEFVDGSVMAQMSPPDMRGPIHFALHYPDRAPSDLGGFDVRRFRELTFDEVDPRRFPALELGYRCLEGSADAGCALNAADEVAVQAFLDGRIGFQEIVPVNRTVLERRPGLGDTIEQLLAADATSRRLAREEVAAAAARRSPTATGT